MRRSLAGKRMTITGASSGIGRAIALEAARRGARVALAARSRDKLAEVAAQIVSAGGDALPVPTDITDADQRRQLFEAVVQAWGGLDLHLNNAGVAAHGHFVDLEPEILRQIMEVNFFAPAELCRLAIPLLAEGEQPMIVNLSSMAGRRGVPAWTEYSASKFALCGFSEALRAELVRFDIDLLLVVPGLTKSDLGANMLAHKGRLPIAHDKGLEPEVVGRKVCDAIEAGKHELRVERDARLLLLVNRFAPRYVDRRMARVVRDLYATEIADRRAARASRSVRTSAPHEAERELVAAAHEDRDT